MSGRDELTVETFGDLGRIAILERDLKEALHHWKACETGWNKSIKQAEGFLRERDEAREDIETLERWLEAKCTIAGCWKTKYERLLKEKGSK